MRVKRLLIWLLGIIAVLGVAAFAALTWFKGRLEPTLPGDQFYVRFHDSTALVAALGELHRRGAVRDPDALKLYARWKKFPAGVSTGTYVIKPGMNADQVLAALQEPVKQMVRIPETNWARRNANVLEDKQVAPAGEYLALVTQPQSFGSEYSFPMPSDSLEGYLYPDTYDLPPLLGARQTIERQLATFEKKVYESLGKPSDLHRLVTIASMVELEVMHDDERAVVAGVIENRLRRDMKLQIDATILYGLQKWRRLTYSDYQNVISPYNTYLHKGLPPGPICSPSLASMKAALKPAKHEYLFYVALPDGRHKFSRTYREHLANIRLARTAREANA